MGEHERPYPPLRSAAARLHVDGRLDGGPAWSWIIDLTAVLLTLSSLTGMVTLVSFRARRRTGFIVAALGVVSIVALYLIAVPR
ncbi:MAG: PepSY-associated TM helix domain-containing protein [Vicinamibacterales bacterium]